MLQSLAACTLPFHALDRDRPASAQLAGKNIALTGGWPDAVQVCVIGNFAKISSTRLNAFSAAACGVALS